MRKTGKTLLVAALSILPVAPGSSAGLQEEVELPVTSFKQLNARRLLEEGEAIWIMFADPVRGGYVEVEAAHVSVTDEAITVRIRLPSGDSTDPKPDSGGAWREEEILEGRVRRNMRRRSSATADSASEQRRELVYFNATSRGT